MVANTQASVQFSGGGNLDKILDKLNKTMKSFGVSAKDSGKSIQTLNTDTQKSSDIFKSLVTNVGDAAKSLSELQNNTKKTVGFLQGTGKATINLNRSLMEANSGATGLGLRFLGLRKQTELLEGVLAGPAMALEDIANAGSFTEKALVLLSKISKPLGLALKFLGNQTEKLANFFKNVEVTLVSLAQKGIAISIKAVLTLSSVFNKLAAVVVNFGQTGRLVSQQLVNISNALGNSTKTAEEFSNSLDPTKLERVDKAGEKVAGTFDNISGKLEKVALGVAIGGAIGGLIARFTGLGQSLQETKENLQNTFTLGSTVIEKTNAKTLLFGNKLNLLKNIAAGVGSAFNNNLAKSIGVALGKVSAFTIAFASMKTVAGSLSDAAIQASGLSDAFAQMQSLGIDTTAAEIAFQIGLVGEKLLFSAEAAKEFGRQAVAAFAKAEDAAAFVTTLSVGAGLQMEGLAAGTETVTAFTSQLANELNNTVTSVQASEALYQSLSAGIGVAADGTADLTAQQKFLESTLKLSSGTGANAAETLNLLSKTTTIYGLSAGDAAITASKLNQVVEEGVTTFGELASSAPDVIPLAESLGISLDEALATVAGLTKVSPSTAEATTGLSSLLSQIAGQGAQAKAEISALGIQFDANSVRTKGLNASLKELVAAAGGNQETLKKIIPDQLAFRTALALTGAAAKSVEGTLTNISNIDSGENLEKVFAAGNQSTIKQFSAIANGFNEVLVDFGRRTLPALEPGIKFLNQLLNILQNLPEPMKNFIGGVVIAQTAFSNIGGAALGLVKTFGQLALSFIAFRLVNKALTGQLGAELDVIKQLIFVENDWAGGISRLLGLNENFSSANIQLTKSLQKSKNALQALKAEGLNINLDDTQIEDFEKALQSLAARRKELNASPLKLVDPETFKKQIADVGRAEKAVKDAIKTTKVARIQSLKEIQTSIDKTLSDSNQTVSQRVAQFEELLKGLFSPQLVKGQAPKLQAEIKNLFGDTLNNATLSAEEKVGRIADTFDRLRAESSPSLKGFISNVEKELLSGFSRLEGQSQKFLATIDGVSQQLFSKLPPTIKEAYDKSIVENKKGILDLEKTLSQRKQSLAKVFEDTLDALPKEVEKLKGPLAAEFTKLLDSSRGDITKRTRELNIAFAQIFAGVPDEIRQQAGAVKLAAQQLTQTLEAPLKGRDNLGDALVQGALSIRRGVKKIDETTPIVLDGINNFSDRVKTTLTSTAESINSKFQTIINDSEISENLKTRLGNIQQTLKENLNKLSVGDVSFEQLQAAFNEARIQANADLENIADEKTRAEIKQNLQKIQADVEKFGKTVERDIAQASRRGGRAVNGLTDSLDGLSGLLAGINPAAASALDGVSRFFSSSQSLGQGASETFGAFNLQTSTLAKNQKVLSKGNQVYVNSLGQVKAAVGGTIQSQGKLAGVQKLMSLGFGGGAKSANAFSAAAVKAGSSTGMLASISAKAGPILGMLGGFAGTAAAGIGSFVVAAAPFIAIGGLVAGAIFVVVRAIQQFLPASSKFADGNRHMAYQIGETNKSIRESLNLVKAYKKDVDSFRDTVTGATKSLKALKEEAAGTAEILDEAGQELEDLPKKEFVQGVTGAIISTLQSFQQLSLQVVHIWTKLPAMIIKGVSDLLSKIPLIGIPFEMLSKGIGGFIEKVDKLFNFVTVGFRKFTNSIAKTTQDFMAAGIREEVSKTSALVDELFLEGERVRVAQKQGEFVTEKAQAMADRVKSQNKALSASQLEEVIRSETDATKLQLEANNEVIKSLEEKAEKVKDPVALESLNRQIALLQGQNSELEKGIALVEEYQRNQNAIASNIVANQAVTSQKALNEQFQTTLKDLKNGDEQGQKTLEIFSNILGIRERINADGDVTFISETSVNQASQAGRRAQAAINSTFQTVSQNIADINDPNANITQDLLAQNTFTAIESVQKAIEEDPAFAEQGRKIMENLLNQTIDTETASGTLRDQLSAAQLEELLSIQSELIDKETAQRTKAQESAIQKAATLQNLGRINAVEAAQTTAQAQEQIDAEQLRGMQEKLRITIQAKGEESAAAKSLARDVANFELQMDLNRLNERKKILDESLNLLRAQKANEVQLIKNAAEAELGNIQLTEKANQFEQKALSSRQNLTQSIAQYEEAILNNKLKLTGDIEEKAEIEVQLAEQRLELSEQENEFEKQNILLQQELNKLALEREQIQLRIQQAENAAQVAENNAKLAQADKINLTQEEAAALELQNQSLQQQSQLLADSAAQLQEFGQKQEQLDQEQLQALDAKAKAREETAQVDLEIARNKLVLAGYDKEIEKLKLQARQVEITSQEKISGLNQATTLLQSQTDILTEQQNLLKSSADIIQKNFSIAISAERNEFRKKKLEEEAAKAKLKALETQQKIEYEIFKLNELQKDLALEVRQIELDASREKAKADLAIAEAEAAKVAADVTATDEQKEAARLSIQAAQSQLGAIDAQTEAVSRQRAANAQGAGLRELQFRQQQEGALTEAEFAVAQTTRRGSDDREIANRALTRAREQQDQFEQLGQSFLSGLGGGVATPTNVSAINLNAGAISPNVSGNLRPDPTSTNFTPVANSGAVINGSLDINISLEGSAEGMDIERVQQEIRNATYQGWNQFLDEVRRR